MPERPLGGAAGPGDGAPDGQAAALLAAASGRPVLEEVPLAGHTTIGCGGPVDFFTEAVSEAALVAILAASRQLSLPCIILGQGSNLLVSDDGWRGLAFVLAGELDGYHISGNELNCGGGLLLPRAARLAAEHGLSGLEPLAGIPGSIGGAVAMNAGAFGATIGRLVARISLCDAAGARTLERGDLAFGYRTGNLPEGSVVSAALLALEPGEPEAIHDAMQQFRARREASQPRGRNCGSVFRNPPEGPGAGELLDRAGCKELSAGGAEVSQLHANFILNRRQATAADVLALMNMCRRRVFESAGVVLEPEVRLLGLELEPLG